MKKEQLSSKVVSRSYFLKFCLQACLVDDKFTKPIVVFRGKNAAYEFNKALVKEYQYCKKIIKKYFNKNVIMSEEEERF